MTHRRLALVAGALALAAGTLLGCGRSDSTVEIEDVRSRERPRKTVPPGADTAARFGLTRGRQGVPPGHPPMNVTKKWSYVVPEGWEELPPNSLREAGFRVAGREDAECTISILQGSGGGLVANVNRWRKQMSLDPVDEKAVAGLPRKPLLGQPAAYVDIAGAYRGMQGDVRIEQARMLGLILTAPRASLYVKLVGPDEVIAAERDRFAQFAASLAPGMSRPPPPHGGDGPPKSSKISWTTPEGWQTRPPRSMREVTIAPPGSTKAECYVAVLGGRAGGAKANIDRWLSQMGQPALDDEGFAKLLRIPMLGGEGVMVEVEGPKFKGQAGEEVEGAMLLGVVLERPTESIFVKMTGPASEVKPHVEAFTAFCRSLSE